MISYSISLNIAWQIAAVESVAACIPFIEKEQILIGLLKVPDILNPDLKTKMEQAIGKIDPESLRRELSPLEETLTRLGIDRIILRRLLRRLVGNGTYVHKERIIHRSEDCKKYFARAENIAKEHRAQELLPIHIVLAIIEDPGPHILHGLRGVSVDAETFVRVLIDESGKSGVPLIQETETKPTRKVLETYCIDLTTLARQGKIEPLVGRKDELLKVIRTLTRKNKNNPMLIGDAGVGKTAIVRGLANRIAEGNITPFLQDKKIIEVSMANLVAGTKYRGEFEERITRLLEEVKGDQSVILFIDEIHTLVGAGAAEGALDAANIMKPALSKGEVSCIGATTLPEYRKYIEKDSALERRFQPVMIEEPTENEALTILEGLRDRYESYHNVKIPSSTLHAAVQLSVRYLPDRRLPDKALDLLDDACTRVKIDSLSFNENRQEDSERTGTVTEQMIARVLAEYSGRPIENIMGEERELLVHLEELLQRRVIGQEDAVVRLSKAIKMSRAGLRESKRPTGVFLFLGRTGVGKTELAKALAEVLFGSEKEMIRLDMSEYMEKHSVAKLIGAPPGYIGYEEEGQLTGKLRRRPYSIVLLDEIEKAHPETLGIFLQVFDEGRLTDAKGRTVDARHAIFIMTSNIGYQVYRKGVLGFGVGEKEERSGEIIEEVRSRFHPEFVNRIDEIVVFKDLSSDNLLRIVCLALNEIQGKLDEQGISLNIPEEALALIARKGFHPEYGARPLRRCIDQLVGTPLTDLIIDRKVAKGDTVNILVKDDNIELVTNNHAQKE